MDRAHGCWVFNYPTTTPSTAPHTLEILNICRLPKIQTFILMWFICLKRESRCISPVLARREGTLQLHGSWDYNTGLFIERMGRVCCNQKWTVYYVRSSGKNWPLPKRKRRGSPYQYAGEGSLLRDGSMHKDTPPTWQAGDQDTDTLIIPFSGLMLFSSGHLPLAYQFWKPGIREPVNAFQKGHHLPKHGSWGEWWVKSVFGRTNGRYTTQTVWEQQLNCRHCIQTVCLLTSHPHY